MTAFRSFVEVSPDSHFPIQNLPYGIFSPLAGGPARVGVAIGDRVLDLAVLETERLFKDPRLKGVFSQPALNAFMGLGRTVWGMTRATLQDLLREDNPLLRDNAALRQRALIPMGAVNLHLPAAIGDYTDFYASKEHATNMGTMLRGKDNALMPNWVHVPIGYHGRSSSIVPSGTNIHRPHGQSKPPDAAEPTFGPSKLMDFELEMGFFVGPGNELGQPIPIGQALDHIFGLVLVNDWSARDIQAWEYQPLGPFLGKNLGTSISPWVVTMEALEPFRCPTPVQDPKPLPYLQGQHDCAYDIQLQVSLQSESMAEPVVITRSNFRNMYWTICQQLAHHTINGCNLRSGDLLASGTISGPTPDSVGCMQELTWRGTTPITLPSGETRKFLEDGDRVTMTAWCQGPDYRVGFGEVTGKILPAIPFRVS